MPNSSHFFSADIHAGSTGRNLWPTDAKLTKAKTGQLSLPPAYTSQPAMKPLNVAPLIFLCLTASAGQAVASCSGAVMLGGIHDAYRATLLEPDPVRTRAAATLLVQIGNRNAAELAKLVSRSGTTVSANKLEEVLQDAKTLAKATLDGNRAEVAAFRHGLNVDWLSKTFVASGCRESLATASRAAPGFASGSVTGATKTASQTAKKRDKTLLFGIAAFGLIIMATYLGYRFHTSFLARRRRVERMPRFPISMPIELAYTDADGHMREAAVQALDISQGGLKLDWPDPPGPGTLITLPLLSMQRIGRVSWSNTYYAGIMFETPLTRQELKSLKETNKKD
jgi:hypothetical protein